MIEQVVVDGVPGLVGSTTGPGHAGLVFRVGAADEPLARRGVTHLVEHLTLHSAGVADYHRHVSEGADYTIFHTAGTEDEIVAFLNGVCAALRDLPMSRLALEKDVLHAEAHGRGTSYDSVMPMWRHGARDYGTPSFPEWGLPRLTSKDVRDWQARYFTRENAALWVTSEGVLEQLDLSLPAGSLMPPPVPGVLPAPAWFEGPDNMVVWDATMPHSAAAAVLAGVLERTMFRTLRQKAGLSYTASTDCTLFAGDQAVVTAVADAVPGKQEQVLDGLVALLASMRDGEIDDADVDAVIAQQAEALLQAEVEGGRLPGQAFNVLVGRPLQSAEEAAAEVRAVSRDDVAAVIAQAWATGLLMAPGGSDLTEAGFTPASTQSVAVTAGTEFVSRDDPADRLVIGEGGVSLVTAENTATVRYADCAILRSWADGARQLVGYDGFSVTIEPTLFGNDAAAAIRHIDGRVADLVRVGLPARDPAQIPRPSSAREPADRSVVGRLVHLFRRTPS